MDALLAALKAVAEPTRLRILVLLEQGELTVSELVQVLGQSQPRISRHLKLMTDAGVLDRFREGSWVFYRLGRGGAGAGVAQCLGGLISHADANLARDMGRLVEVKGERDRAARAYFQRVASDWDEVRSLHVDDREVERTLLDLLPAEGLGEVLDLGTGTGRMLELLANRATRCEGVDLSHDMLSVARANLDRAGVANASVRQADIYQLPFDGDSFDTIIIHQVLHFLDRPAAAIAEAARVLRPGGRLVVVDFAPHDLETLRTEHAHHRLGFSVADVTGWFQGAHLTPGAVQHLVGDPLTVTIWQATHE